MSGKTAWATVGELGLDKLTANTDPRHITFGELAKKYLAEHRFNKHSTKKWQTRIINKVLLPKWSDYIVTELNAKELRQWLLGFHISDVTRDRYRHVMSHLIQWGISEELLPQYLRGFDGTFQSANPCTRVKGNGFSQHSGYEALALDPEDSIALLSEIDGKTGEYELMLLVATCGLRISEALGLKWRDILWDKALISIRQTFVQDTLQEGGKTKLSGTRVEVPRLVLDVLASWREQTLYAGDDDFVFASYKLHGKQPRAATSLNRDYVRPAAIRAGILIERDGKLYSQDGAKIARFGFHNLGRHSLATFLMDEQENPAVVQAILRHSKMDMTLYYSHSSKKAKRAAVENYAKRITPDAMRGQVRVQYSQAVN